MLVTENAVVRHNYRMGTRHAFPWAVETSHGEFILDVDVRENPDAEYSDGELIEVSYCPDDQFARPA